MGSGRFSLPSQRSNHRERRTAFRAPKGAGEVMWTYTSPTLYELLVIRRGWSPQQFGDFIADALTAALLDA